MKRTSSRLCGVLTAVMLAVVFHAQWLPLVVYPLTRSDRPANDAQFLLFLRSAKAADDAYAFAVDFARTDTDRRVLVFRDFVRRAEQLGAEIEFIDATVAMLQEQGVPADQIQVIGDGQAITSGEVLAAAAEWLANRSTDSPRMLVITHRLMSGYLRDVASSQVSAKLQPSMQILGFPKKRIDQHNWWKTRSGVKLVIRESLRLVHLWIFGERRPKMGWDPDAYERSLKEQRGHA